MPGKFKHKIEIETCQESCGTVLVHRHHPNGDVTVTLRFHAGVSSEKGEDAEA